MRTHLTTLLIAGAMTMATVSGMQNPPSPPSQPQSPRPTPTERPSARGSEGLVTLEGCLMQESAVEGRSPRVPEGGGSVTGDYVLTRAKVIKGDAPASLTGMYDIDELDPATLASLVGQRVEIDGWFDDLDRASNPAGREGAQGDLVEIRGSAVRPVAMDCTN